MRKKDVYLSKMCLIFGLLMLCFALACLLMGIPWVAAALLVLIGGGLILAWVNQWVIMVDEQTFISSNMFGRKRTLRFDDIRGYQSVYRTGNFLVMDSCEIYLGDYVSARFKQAVEAHLHKKTEINYYLNDRKLTGDCWKGMENVNRLLLLFGFILLAFTALSISLKTVFPAIIALPFCLMGFALWNKSRQLISTFELTEDGVRTMSKGAFMQRSAAWEEVTLIQIAALGTSPRGKELIYAACFVFVKGAENALIRCEAGESPASISSNPNRIPIPMNHETKPVVLRLAEQKGIPIDCLPAAREYYESGI